MRPASLLLLLLVAAALTGGCTKKSASAVVIAKEHIPAHVEGTEYRERQTDREQWLVRVRMENGRTVDAPVEEAQWRSLQIDDRVRVDYSEGDYTGTVWGIDVRKP